MMKRLLILLVLLLVLPLSADASTVYLSAAPGEASLPAEAVTWHEVGGICYFFMPGGTDWASLRLWTDGGSVLLDGQEIASGDPVALTPGQPCTITADGEEHAVQILQGSAIPALFIETVSGSMDAVDAGDSREAGAYALLAPDGTTDTAGALDYIKLRGSSANQAKKSYAVKLDKGADLAGMGKAKRWVLLGAGKDDTGLRNQLVFAMAAFVGLHYSPDCVQVDLYVNHEYRGVYLLTEKIEVNKERVAIDDLQKATEVLSEDALDSYPLTGEMTAAPGAYKAYDLPHDPDDITGGYIIEYDSRLAHYGDEPCAYVTESSKVLLVKDPAEASVAQVAYIGGFMQGFERAILSPDGVDPETDKAYDDFVDLDSLVRKFMIEEISMNRAAANNSQYFYKPADSRSEKAFAGPVWDYDASFGAKGASPEEAFFTEPDGEDGWWPALYAHEDFRTEVRVVWAADFAPAMHILLGRETDPDGRLLSISQYADAIRASSVMDGIRWSAAGVAPSFDACVDELTQTVEARFAFLDGLWGE